LRLNQILNRPPQESSAGALACSPPPVPCSPPAWGTLFRNREQNSGMTVMATTNEAINERQKASASAEKRNLLTPYRNVTGKKSTTSTRVAANTARFTSAPPCSAATSGEAPNSKWR